MQDGDPQNNMWHRLVTIWTLQQSTQNILIVGVQAQSTHARVDLHIRRSDITQTGAAFGRTCILQTANIGPLLYSIVVHTDLTATIHAVSNINHST